MLPIDTVPKMPYDGAWLGTKLSLPQSCYCALSALERERTHQAHQGADHASAQALAFT